jgi:hypothetical protein
MGFQRGLWRTSTTFITFINVLEKPFQKVFHKSPPKNPSQRIDILSLYDNPDKRDSNEDYQQKPYSIPNILLNYHYLTHFYISILLISCREPTVPRRRTVGPHRAPFGGTRPLPYPFFRITYNKREGS